MIRYFIFALGIVPVFLNPAPVFAQQDSAGCKDTPLFTRMPGHYIARCDSSQFVARNFPVGAPGADSKVKTVTVEGPLTVVVYRPTEGTATPPSPLQVQRNFEAAAKKAGGTVEGTYPAGCAVELDKSFELGNGCITNGSTLKIPAQGKEVWVFVNATSMGQTGYRDGYAITMVEREEMAQDIVATDLLARINADGMVALYLNFATGSATIDASSNSQIDQIAAMLKAAPALAIEVGGHTDNVGAADANLKLSEARAAAVVKALAGRGVAATRLTAKGYGQAQPIADNRTEDGRAKNRRVELVKR